VQLYEIGALFAAALAARGQCDLMIYGDTGLTVKDRPRSVLRTIELIHTLEGKCGHGTNTWPSVLSQYDNHDRIFVFTDMQDHPARAERGLNTGHYLDPNGRFPAGNGKRYSYGAIPATKLPDVPVYVWDLQGYRVANTDLSVPNRYLIGGFSDAAFRLIGLLERGQRADWPWMSD
jgi:hypothetical protein